jgi:hypothetical protein
MKERGVLKGPGLLDADIQSERCIGNLLEVSIRPAWSVIATRLSLALSEKRFHD